MSTIAERRLTPTLRAILLAERALEKCTCGSSERDAALEALRRVLQEQLSDSSEEDDGEAATS